MGKPEIVLPAMSRDGLYQLPVFLFVASIANTVFLYVAARDHVSNLDSGTRSRTAALLGLSAAEFIWVVPCFLQCLATLISNGGPHWWVAADHDTGCGIMGFYSIFASVSSQLFCTQLAFITHTVLVRKSTVESKHVVYGSAASFVIAFLISLLPVMGVGSFKYSGEGFCYIDWSNAGQVVCMEVVTYPAFFAVCYWFGSCALYVEPAEEESCVSERPLVRVPPRYWWWFLLLAYVSAWVLWLPAIFIGLDSSQEYPAMFPAGYMIAGGALGHAQALLNPFFYGVKWRTWFNPKKPASALVEGSDAKLSAVLPGNEAGDENI